MNVSSYLTATGVSIRALAIGAEVPYTSLHPHVRHGRPLSVESAKKLQRATLGAISAAEVLGLEVPTTPAPRARKARKAEPALDSRQLVVPGAA